MRQIDLAAVDANLLVALDALLDERSVSAAARRMGLSQPAMSHTLRRLRALFDDPLLLRKGHGMEPTPAALELAAPLREGIRHLTVALQGQSAVSPINMRREFHIAASDYAAFRVMQPFLREVHDSGSTATVRIARLQGRHWVRALYEGSIDLAIGTFTETPSDLEATELTLEPYRLVARLGHPASPPTDISALRHQRFVDALAADGSNGEHLRNALHAAGLRPDVAVTTANPHVAACTVAASDLLAFLPASLAKHFSQVLPIQDFPCPMPLPRMALTIVHNPASSADRALAWVRASLRQAVANE